MIVTSGDVSVSDCSGYGVVTKVFTTSVVDGTVTPSSLYVYVDGTTTSFYNKNGDTYTNVIDESSLPSGYDPTALKSFTSIGDDLVVDMTTLQLELVSEGKPNVNVLVCEAGSTSDVAITFQHVGNYVVTVSGKPVNSQLSVNEGVVTYSSLFGETAVVTSGVYTGSNPKDLLSTVDQTVLYNMFSSNGYPQPSGGIEELKAKLSGYDALLKELCKRSFYITSNATAGTVDKMFNDYVGNNTVYKPVPDNFSFRTSNQQAWVAAEYQHFDMKLYSLEHGNSLGELCSGNIGITNLDLSLWQVGTVGSMGFMFRNCRSLQSLNLSGWNTRNVIDMNGVFQGCNSLQSLDLSSFDTSKVEEMSYMFTDCSSLQSLDLSSFDTSSVNNMEGMFAYCTNLQTLDLSSFDTSKVEYMYGMFFNCTSLQTLDLSSFNTSSVTRIPAMFEGCSSLQTLDISNFSLTSSVETRYAVIGCMSLTTVYIDNCNDTTVNIFKDLLTGLTEQTVNGRKCLRGTFTGARIDVPDDFEFDNYNPVLSDLAIVFPYFDMQKYIADKGPASLANLFEGNTNVTILDLQWWQTGAATDMSNMFKDCTSLTTINLSRLFTISATTNVTSMFSGCISLIMVYYGPNSKSKLQPLLTGFTDNTTLQAFVKQ